MLKGLQYIEYKSVQGQPRGTVRALLFGAAKGRLCVIAVFAHSGGVAQDSLCRAVLAAFPEMAAVSVRAVEQPC